jgi:glycosyltransferase involved in cell wall biosynthesis
VVHVLSSFGLGGQERVALDLARGQVAAGCRVSAVSLAGDDGPLASELRAAGADVRAIAKRGGYDATLTARLAAYFAGLRARAFAAGARSFAAGPRAPLVVHTHNPQPLIYAAPAARLCGAGAVHTKHGANPDGGRRLWLRRAAARCTHAYVAVSALTADVARRNREVDERKLHTIANGIDLARFHPDAAARAAVRAELGVGERDFVVGTVGRLAAEKDQALLIAAVAPLLASDGPGDAGARGGGGIARLVIVGDGAERAALATQIAALDERGRRVVLTGARADVPRLLAAFDAFALSSRTEGLPLVIAEAMAVGLPVVSTAVGGIPDVVVVDGGAAAPGAEAATGALVPPGDAHALGAALARLARDPALGKEWGTRGRARALARYSSERMVNDYLALYRRILA